ncbi:hypothetical protein LTR82_017707 [Friedmanniomyces endolithicus]|uniref:Uncharacterized protein n=1 Tax=Friedmanniomyces endolithicus TaxID=329885 RepID=A0AAN6F7H0_9PEZI|nr:hypothetical protein LTR82_017707 [Friedmanniomyces endolithicus]
MLYNSIVTASVAFASVISALPTELSKRANIDTTVLQFALTLEHLENVFYKQALKNFSQEDFQKAGYSADYYNDLKYIAHDEEQHVLLLEGALTVAGVTPVQACTYSFPYYDVRSFITLSSVLEGVGTSAYLGGAPLITSKQYLTVAASILVTEALHTSLQRLAINEVPMANPYGTPLDPLSVYTLAAMFIVSCPASNAALPFTSYPSLQVDGSTCTCEEPQCGSPSDVIKRGSGWASKHHNWPETWRPQQSNSCMPPSPGKSVTFTANSTIPAGSYVTFVSGLSVVSVQGNINGTDINAVVPSQAMGQTYVFVTSRDEKGTLTAADIKYGPAVLEVNPPPPSIDYSIMKE